VQQCAGPFSLAELAGKDHYALRLPEARPPMPRPAAAAKQASLRDK